MANDTNLNDILAQRAQTHGTFESHAQISQHLKATVRRYLEKRDKHLADDQAEAVDMILHKLARIVNGDANFHDHWLDISGYSKLVADRLQGTVR